MASLLACNTFAHGALLDDKSREWLDLRKLVADLAAENCRILVQSGAWDGMDRLQAKPPLSTLPEGGGVRSGGWSSLVKKHARIRRGVRVLYRMAGTMSMRQASAIIRRRSPCSLSSVPIQPQVSDRDIGYFAAGLYVSEASLMDRDIHLLSIALSRRCGACSCLSPQPQRMVPGH